MAKITDVARHASVSTATVSRVISQPELVSEATRTRVRAAISELSYEPNRAARSLRTLRASKLLVTVPDISNPFFSNVIRGAEEAARAAGYAVVLGDTRDDAVLENQYASMLRRHEVDGLVFLGHRLPDTPAAGTANGKGPAPVVNGCEYSPSLGVSSVHIDNAAAGADAAEHLIDLEHRRIGVITGPMVSPLSQDRLAGVNRVVSRHGPGVDLRVRHGDFSVKAGFEHGLGLLSEDVTAIFCFSDEMAIGAVQAGRHLGRSCPDDFSVIGFDDIRFAQYMTPALTTIFQPAAEIGRRAVELVLRTISGELAMPHVIILPHRLVLRESTGPGPI